MMVRIDDVAQRADLLTNLVVDQPVPRRFPCPGCGQDIGRNVWACDGCAARALVERRDSMLRPARESIPQDFRACRFSTPDLARWIVASPGAIAGARDALSGESALVTILGSTGVGKTTLACAMLAEVIEAGADLRCAPDVLERARTAYFVDALRLSQARQEARLGTGEPRELLRAKKASVLVVDEFGRDRALDVDVTKIIHERQAAKRLTIVTTWLDQAEIATSYDGGIARRLFQRATVFRLGSTT